MTEPLERLVTVKSDATIGDRPMTRHELLHLLDQRDVELATLRSERDTLAAALEEAERALESVEQVAIDIGYDNLRLDAQQALDRIQQIKQGADPSALTTNQHGK